MKMQSWSIVVFCYNEVKTVANVMTKAENIMAMMGISDYEILVVDDGSTDGSREVIEAASKNIAHCKLVFHGQNQGIGAALRSGYFNATKENICAIPADGQFELKELIPHATVQENHFVSFYRQENTTYSPARNLLSFANKMVNKYLNKFHFKDVNWVKIYKRPLLETLDLEIQSSLIESEICAKLVYLGNKVIEVRSVYLPRTAGVSKGASFKILKQAIRDTIQLSLVLARFRKKIKN